MNISAGKLQKLQIICLHCNSHLRKHLANTKLSHKAIRRKTIRLQNGQLTDCRTNWNTRRYAEMNIHNHYFIPLPNRWSRMTRSCKKNLRAKKLTDRLHYVTNDFCRAQIDWLPLSWELCFSSRSERPLVSLSSGEYLARGECLLSGLNLKSWALESRLPTCR